MLARDENAFGIAGPYYSYADAFTSIHPQTFAELPPGPVCISGHFPGVVDSNYDEMYGAGLGLLLNLNEETEEIEAYDATAHEVTGFSFVLSGQAPQPLQFNIKMKDVANSEVYCVRDIQSGYNEVRFADVVKSCWESSYGEPVDPTLITDIQWTTPAYFAPFDYCYCIDQLSVLTD